VRRLTVPRSQFACHPGVATRAVSKANGIRCCEALTRASGSFFADTKLCQQCLRSTSDSRPGCIHAYRLAYNLDSLAVALASDVANRGQEAFQGSSKTPGRVAGLLWRSRLGRLGHSRASAYSLGGCTGPLTDVATSELSSGTQIKGFSKQKGRQAERATKTPAQVRCRIAAICPQRWPKT